MGNHTVVRWEYREVYLSWGVDGFNPDGSVNMAQPLYEQLNVYGEDGWELVEIRQLQTSGNAMFKRLRPPRRE